MGNSGLPALAARMARHPWSGPQRQPSSPVGNGHLFPPQTVSNYHPM